MRPKEKASASTKLVSTSKSTCEIHAFYSQESSLEFNSRLTLLDPNKYQPPNR